MSWLTSRIWVLVVLGLAFAGGCQKSVRMSASRPSSLQASSNVGEVTYEDFLDWMVQKPKCTVADACRAVAILMEGRDVEGPFQARYQYLLQRDVVRSAWKLREDQWIDRGTLAFMLYKALNIPGGVNMALFGSWGLGDRRFAYREMLYRDLMQRGVDYNYVTGPELVTALGKADAYMRETGQYSPKSGAGLGDKPGR